MHGGQAPYLFSFKCFTVSYASSRDKLHTEQMKQTAYHLLTVVFTNQLDRSAFYRMPGEECGSGKNDFNIRASAVVTANLTPLIRTREKAVGREAGENTLEKAESRGSLL